MNTLVRMVELGISKVKDEPPRVTVEVLRGISKREKRKYYKAILNIIRSLKGCAIFEFKDVLI